MIKIEQLLQKHCPNGVEFKELGNVCEIKTGQSVSKALIQNNSGNFPVINSGKEPLGYINKFNTDNDPIGITSRGAGVGSITYYEGKYFRGNLNYAVSINDKNSINVRFLYHVLIQNKKGIQQLCSFNGIPALNASKLKTFQIPIPPIEIQEEIVNILDKFSQLEAELEAELEARNEQYKYYRDELLSFGDYEVEWKELGEVGEMIRGNGLQKIDFTENGFPCIHYGQLYTFYGTFADKTKSFCSFELAKKLRIAKFGDVLIAGTSENIEDVNKATGWLGNYEVAISGDMFAFRPNSELNGKFLTYLFQTKRYFDYKKKYARGTKVTRVPSKNIEQFKIPIISLNKQQEIVAILDKFDALVNDISFGLPAELEARRQQYEYYRNKLLSFKPLVK